ncbi:MAG TPA: hypothetical protein VKA18_07270 [Alphaproteobacteria bacterium]|nr:hypothetical protein [Alphaproteobacteria bacterium]
MLTFLRYATIVGAVALLPFNASALVMTGFFSGPAPSLTIGDSAQGNVSAMPFEPFGGVSGSIVAAENLSLRVTSTVNPFLDALSGSGFSNSIDLNYQINSGPLVNIPITQTNMTGSSVIAGLNLAQNDQVTFFIEGNAGRFGNDVDVNASAIPLPPGVILSLSALAGFAFLMRRKKA